MKILILGGSGFLGRLVATRLTREGHKVTCFVRNANITRANPDIEYIQATVDDARAISDHAQDADYLLHFAWDTTPGTSKGQPVVEAVNNLLPTFRLIEQLHIVDDCQLVFISSAGAIYDEARLKNAVETSPLNPKSYYGAGKLAVENFLRAYCAQTDHPVVIVRPSNVYGPGQLLKRQFGIVPTLMRAISTGNTFTVWGDGESTRDFVYADDFATFFVSLIERKWEGLTTLNLASETSCTINELCALLEKISGRQLSLEYFPERGVDLRGARIDASQARAKLGWTASTELEVGLQNTWEWFINSQ